MLLILALVSQDKNRKNPKARAQGKQGDTRVFPQIKKHHNYISPVRRAAAVGTPGLIVLQRRCRGCEVGFN